MNLKLFKEAIKIANKVEYECDNCKVIHPNKTDAETCCNGIIREIKKIVWKGSGLNSGKEYYEVCGIPVTLENKTLICPLSSKKIDTHTIYDVCKQHSVKDINNKGYCAFQLALLYHFFKKAEGLIKLENKWMQSRRRKDQENNTQIKE